MAIKENARYEFGLHYVQMFALNYDLTIPAPTRIVGGIGPFDFTGVADDEAVPMTVAIDGTSYDIEVDISAAVKQSAVTVEELVIALNAVFDDVGLPIAITASKEAVTNYLLLVCDTVGAVAFQAYGECAELAGIGQGFGVKIFTSDTFRSMNETHVRKDSERITTTDAWGIDTEVITPGYYKGVTLAAVDTAEDWEMYGLLEGTLVADDGSLSSPTFETERPMVGIKLYYAKYHQGQNHEPEMEGYRMVTFYRCKGMGGDKTRERGFADANYTIEATTYRNSAGVQQSAWKKDELTVEAFKALLLGTY
jgi:hypothetical protein